MMKYLLCLLLPACFFPAHAAEPDSAEAPNIVIITIDGLRWQEVFYGMDEQISARESYVSDPRLLQQLYGAADTPGRRQRLMPFFWNVIAQQGQLYGNRRYGNRMNVTNWYKFSYPGYSELFTGFADTRFVPNTKVQNQNTNLLEFLNGCDAYRGRVAAFSSWNVFPYILNEARSGIPVNSGYEPMQSDAAASSRIDRVQQALSDEAATRFDELTYLQAREYIRRHHPKITLLSFGEADEFAHHGHYDYYLQSIHNTDRMIGELWYLMQADPFYKGSTTFLITTDHGRGRGQHSWTDHLFLVGGSREIWMAVMGPGIAPLGEVQQKQLHYQRQVAGTVAGLLGTSFSCEHPVAAGMELPGVAPAPAAAPVWVLKPADEK